MTATMFLPPALLLLALWFTHHMNVDHREVATSTPLDRVTRSLRDRLARGELSVDEFRRLVALISPED